MKRLHGWGRPGDRALIATSAGERVGAAWYRLWRPDDHSYGFVDAHTPELGIAVARDHRRRGGGRTLPRRLVALARSDGHGALSLSVSSTNPARSLYASGGFVLVAEDRGGSWTMLRNVRASEGSGSPASSAR